MQIARFQVIKKLNTINLGEVVNCLNQHLKNDQSNQFLFLKLISCEIFHAQILHNESALYFIHDTPLCRSIKYIIYLIPSPRFALCILNICEIKLYRRFLWESKPIRDYVFHLCLFRSKTEYIVEVWILWTRTKKIDTTTPHSTLHNSSGSERYIPSLLLYHISSCRWICKR